MERTLVDAFLISLSAANTLHQKLGEESAITTNGKHQIDPLRKLVNAVGRFADACEKIDHLEEFTSMARAANIDVINWVIHNAEKRSLDLVVAAKERRAELKARCFYLED